MASVKSCCRSVRHCGLRLHPVGGGGGGERLNRGRGGVRAREAEQGGGGGQGAERLNKGGGGLLVAPYGIKKSLRHTDKMRWPAVPTKFAQNFQNVSLKMSKQPSCPHLLQ